MLEEADWRIQAGLPGFPKLPQGWLIGRSRSGQGLQDGGQFLFEPGVKHGIRAARHPFHAHLAAGRMKEGQ